MDAPDKPIVTIGPLSGPDGNAWALMAYCRDALRAVGRQDEWPAIQADMMSGDYQHLLDVMDQHFTVAARAAVTLDWRST